MITFFTVTGILCVFISPIYFSIGIYSNLSDKNAEHSVGQGTSVLAIGLIFLLILPLAFKEFSKFQPFNLSLIRSVFFAMSVYFCIADWLYLIVALLITAKVIKEGEKRTSWCSFGRFVGLMLLTIFFFALSLFLMI